MFSEGPLQRGLNRAGQDKNKLRSGLASIPSFLKLRPKVLHAVFRLLTLIDCQNVGRAAGQIEQVAERIISAIEHRRISDVQGFRDASNECVAKILFLEVMGHEAIGIRRRCLHIRSSEGLLDQRRFPDAATPRHHGHARRPVLDRKLCLAGKHSQLFFSAVKPHLSFCPQDRSSSFQTLL